MRHHQRLGSGWRDRYHTATVLLMVAVGVLIAVMGGVMAGRATAPAAVCVERCRTTTGVSAAVISLANGRCACATTAFADGIF